MNQDLAEHLRAVTQELRAQTQLLGDLLKSSVAQEGRSLSTDLRMLGVQPRQVIGFRCPACGKPRRVKLAEAAQVGLPFNAVYAGPDGLHCPDCGSTNYPAPVEL